MTHVAATNLDGTTYPHLTQGEPYSMLLTITDGNTQYPDGASVRGQIRKAVGNKLYLDLTDRLTTTVNGDNLQVELQLTGADTRQVHGPGVYDIFIQDAGDDDETRAVRLLHGSVTIEPAVTRDGVA